jgi:hypothetical protein
MPQPTSDASWLALPPKTPDHIGAEARPLRMADSISAFRLTGVERHGCVIGNATLVRRRATRVNSFGFGPTIIPARPEPGRSHGQVALDGVDGRPAGLENWADSRQLRLTYL